MLTALSLILLLLLGSVLPSGSLSVDAPTLTVLVDARKNEVSGLRDTVTPAFQKVKSMKLKRAVERGDFRVGPFFEAPFEGL
uniref:Secreted protein n=1 Tax=Steinernema glaseri TaxID=37863 RepID=A0A1I8AES7_9BILA